MLAGDSTNIFYLSAEDGGSVEFFTVNGFGIIVLDVLSTGNVNMYTHEFN
jgi:hypothetical protein